MGKASSTVVETTTLEWYDVKLRCPQTPTAPRTLTVAVTGASGSIFARHLLDALDRDERVATVNLILSDSGLRVMAEELQISGRNELLNKTAGTSFAQNPPAKQFRHRRQRGQRLLSD